MDFMHIWGQKKPSGAPNFSVDQVHINMSLFKKHYAKRYSWRTSFTDATPVANWRTGSAAYYVWGDGTLCSKYGSERTASSWVTATYCDALLRDAFTAVHSLSAYTRTLIGVGTFI